MKNHNLLDLRKDILEILERSTQATSLSELSKQLHIKSESEDYDYLKDVLNSMSAEGILQKHARRRYSIAHHITHEFIGTLTYYHDSATVRTTDASAPPVLIKRQHLHTALDGDTVRVHILAPAPGKKIQGEVLGIIERAPHAIAGTIEFDGSFYYLIPDEPRYHMDFMIAESNLKGAKAGDKVIGRFIKWDNPKVAPEAAVRDVIGVSGKALVEFTAILKEFNLPSSFPAEVEKAANALSEPALPISNNREDITDTLIITIDPADARDFDDALSLTELQGGDVELGVHIADVSHYVTPGSVIDTEALKRGTSTYLVHAVVPMLPERLSNNLCSLVPNKPRYAYSVFMRFTRKGMLKHYRITETLIESKKRLTYDEAQSMIDAAVEGSGTPVDPVANLVVRLHSLAKTLFARRMKHGGIDFETQEVKYLLNEEYVPVSAVVKSRTDATSLVEECMLAANRVVAEHVEKLSESHRCTIPLPLVYRTHGEPDSEKLTDAVSVIRALGIPVPSGKLTPVQINAILTAVQDRPEKAVVNTLLLRSMAKAVYAEHNIGHYGLGFTAYAHFTSPIRRYPDLFVHRMLKEYAQGIPGDKRLHQVYEQSVYVSDHSSQTERMAVEAERASQKLAQVMIARTHLGERHHGYVTGVTNFGIFVTISTLMCEGLLHIRDLRDDFYVFDEKRFRLIGRRNRRIFQYGTELDIVIARTDIDKRLIDLVVADPEQK